MERIVKDAATTSIFRGIEPSALSMLLKRVHAFRRTYKKGEFIAHEGMRAEAAYVIVSGRVNLIMAVDESRIHVARDLHAGDPVGISLLYCDGDRGPSPAWVTSTELPCWNGSVQAVETTTVIGFNILQARRLSSTGDPQYHQVYINTLYILSDGLLNNFRKQVVMSRESAEDRVMMYLRWQRNNQMDGVIEIPFNQGDWANYLGIGRSSLCRALQNLKKQGKINWHGHFYHIF